MKIFIIGSAGFVLSNFARKFAFKGNNQNHTLAALDNFANPWSEKSFYSKPTQSFHIADATDPKILSHLFQKEQPEIVIHGAQVQDGDIIKNNVFATQHLIDLCVQYHSKLIFLSSEELYEASETIPTEDTPIEPKTVYGASLAAGEVLIRAAHSTHGLDYLILRLCSQFGPWESYRYGLIPKMIDSIIKNERFEISPYTREWMFVEETFHILNLLIERNQYNETYNLTTGHEFSELELYHQICGLMEGKEQVICKYEQPLARAMNGQKLKDIGYKPMNKFKDSLMKTVNWYINNPWFIEVSK